jgi:integrase
VTLRAIFDCAAKHGWINQERIPKIETKKTRDNPRAHFTPEEIDQLLASEDDWIAAARNERDRAIRRLTADYVSVLLTTGLRPGEALKLKWGDVEFFRDADGIRNMRIWVADDTKTGKRDAVAFARGEVTVTAMALGRDAVRKRKDQPLFATLDGRTIKTFAGEFTSWLKFAGLLTNPRGEKRTIYCCRHTYMTEALAVGHSIHVVAKQCGTGTGMIDRFYSKVSSSLNASQLSGRKPVR